MFLFAKHKYISARFYFLNAIVHVQIIVNVNNIHQFEDIQIMFTKMELCTANTDIELIFFFSFLSKNVKMFYIWLCFRLVLQECIVREKAYESKLMAVTLFLAYVKEKLFQSTINQYDSYYYKKIACMLNLLKIQCQLHSFTGY